MPIEIIGLFSHRADGQGVASEAAQFDTDFVKALVHDYEDNGYDRMLIATTASWADSLNVASYLSGVCDRLKFMIAHRPGFVAPTMAARMLATIDQLSGGRAGVHIITGANDVEMQSDGDFLPKDERYHRSAEYAQILRRIWTETEPFDHEGRFYRFKQAHARVRPVQPSIPIYWGGASGSALEMGAEAADVYAFGIEPLARAAALIDEVQGHAKAKGRQLRLCVSTKVILGDTEEAAWAYADEILQETIEKQNKAGRRDPNLGANARRLELDQMEQLQDKRLWLGLNRAMGGKGHGVALVGTGEQVADALLDYYDLGVRSFLMHGFDTPNDPKRFGAALIPALRAGVDARERQADRKAG